MEMSVARFKPLWSGWMSGAARPPVWPLTGLSDAQSCSNYFQVSPHAEEIIIINLRSGGGIKYLSASRTVTIEQGSQTERGGQHENVKIVKRKK